MKQLVVVLVTVSFALLLSDRVRAQPNKEANSLARRGTEAAKDQNWDEAVNDLRKATEMDRKYAPSLAAALQGRAAAYASQQKFSEAAADYDEVIKLNPRNASALEGRASVAMKTNDTDKALAAYGEAIKLNPHEIRYYLYRGYILEVKGDFKNAMVDTEKALKIQKDNPDALARKTRLTARLAQEATPPPQSPPKK
jgi:tetratricopeptide (TPR) repeat protein